VDRLNRLFNIRLGQSVIVRVQNPISIDDYSEPEPDVALLRPREDFYDAAHPQPADILLIVEVADTSVEYDRALKVPLYARAGVPEVWLVNLPAERVEIFARPAAGAYPAAREVARGQALVSETVSGLTLNADDILG
jgi:Uma2 family endonuclease